VLFAAQVAVSFGVIRVGVVYPFVFLAYGLAGIVGPPAGGWILENFSLLFACCIVAGIAISGSVLFFASFWKVVPDLKDGIRRQPPVLF